MLAVDRPASFSRVTAFAHGALAAGRNEITSISGATTPAYDSSGNTTADEAGQTYVFDAWNRLVGVKDSSGTVIAGYGYDALGRRVSENGRDLYYSGSEIIEERDGGRVAAQNVWSLAYVEALVCRDVDADGNAATGTLGKTGTASPTSGLDTRYYVQQDADWNVTAITCYSGNRSAARIETSGLATGRMVASQARTCLLA